MERAAGLIEQNSAELLMTMGAAGGGVQRDDERVRWTIGGSPIDYHNAVVAADLDPAEADDVIASSIRVLRERNVPGTWHVGPGMRPSDLGERLLAAGFTDGGAEQGMALELADLRQPEPVPGLTVDRVETADELARWVRTLARGFGEGEKEAAWVGEVYARLGLADPWRHYLARLDGEPVGTATVYLTGTTAGVYFVMTVPEARRRGIGAATTWSALDQSRDQAERAVLTSSAAGRSVYHALGFADVCPIALYELAVPAVDDRGAAVPAED